MYKKIFTSLSLQSDLLSGKAGNIRKLMEKSCQGKHFLANFTFAAAAVFSRLMWAVCCCLLNLFERFCRLFIFGFVAIKTTKINDYLIINFDCILLNIKQSVYPTSFLLFRLDVMSIRSF